MDNLFLCSKVLCDVNISDKINEIQSLKSKISILEDKLNNVLPPKIFCKNHKEWHDKIHYMLSYIYDNVTNIQLVDIDGGTDGDADIFSGDGLWLPSDKIIKTELLQQVFMWLTDKEDWSKKVACELIADIKSVLDLLKLHEKYTDIERRHFIYYFMYEKLCDRHNTSLLADIPQYKCTACGAIYNDPYDTEDDGQTFEIVETCHDCS